MDISEYQKHTLLGMYNMVIELGLDNSFPFVRLGLKEQMESDLDINKTIEWGTEKYRELSDKADNYYALTQMSMQELEDFVSDLAMLRSVMDKDLVSRELESIPLAVSGPTFQVLFEKSVREMYHNG